MKQVFGLILVLAFLVAASPLPSPIAPQLATSALNGYTLKTDQGGVTSVWKDNQMQAAYSTLARAKTALADPIVFQISIEQQKLSRIQAAMAAEQTYINVLQSQASKAKK